MKADYSKMWKKIAHNGKTNYLIILGISGILLMSIGNFDYKKNEADPQNDISMYTYKHQLEKELTSFIREIDGAGKVKVLVYLESGEENIYVQQEKSVNTQKNNSNESKEYYDTQTTYENEYVIVKKSGEDAALIEKTMQPTIKGVAVACSGADNISVVSAVTGSVSAALGVPTHKIFVTKIR